MVLYSCLIKNRQWKVFLNLESHISEQHIPTKMLYVLFTGRWNQEISLLNTDSLQTVSQPLLKYWESIKIFEKYQRNIALCCYTWVCTPRNSSILESYTKSNLLLMLQSRFSHGAALLPSASQHPGSCSNAPSSAFSLPDLRKQSQSWDPETCPFEKLSCEFTHFSTAH